MEYPHESNDELHNNEIDTTTLLLDILDDRHTIAERIERSSNAILDYFYESSPINNLKIPNNMVGIISPQACAEVSFNVKFIREPGEQLKLQSMIINPADSSPVELTRNKNRRNGNDSGYLLDTGHGYWSGRDLDRDCLNFAIPLPENELLGASIEQYADYFANTSPQFHESRKFCLIENGVVYCVNSENIEASMDSIDRLEIARLQPDGGRYIGTRLVLEESMVRRQTDQSGEKLSAILYIEKVEAASPNDVISILSSDEYPFFRNTENDIYSGIIDMIDDDHKSDIIDSLDMLKRSSLS